MAKHAATPNSETTEKANPSELSAETASSPPSRYGSKSGSHPGQGDHSTERIVSAS